MHCTQFDLYAPLEEKLKERQIKKCETEWNMRFMIWESHNKKKSFSITNK